MPIKQKTVDIKKRYTVGVKDSDCGGFMHGNTFDEFYILRDAIPVLIVRFDYGGDESDDKACVHRLTDFYPSELPEIAGGHHLIAYLLNRLDNALCRRGEEFYRDIFCNEDGEAIIRRPLYD